MSGVAAPRELVLASAGSGKTYRIASRLIALIAYGEDPEQILAATFTRKAAGQILGKVLTRLAGAVLDEAAAVRLAGEASLIGAPPLPTSPAFWSEVLERTIRSLHRFNVGTLDAFFMRAAGAFDAELGLPPGWRIPAEPTARWLRSQALLEVLARSDRRRLVELLRLVSRGGVRRSIHEHLASMLDQLLEIDEQLDREVADPWGAFAAAGGEEPLPTREDRERLARSLEALDLPRTGKGEPHSGWVKAVAHVAVALREGDWEGLVAQSLCNKVATGEGAYYRVPIDGPTRACVEEVLDAARAALRPRLGSQVEALGELTGAYRDSFRKLQRRHGLYGFRDITRLIGSGDPLGNRADLYYRLDARTRHVLLDEFQDTSLLQWEALEPIVDEVLSDDSRAAVVVADPKQSIYGWRGAEPDVVHDVGRRYSLDEEKMATSWRSSPVVLDFVNAVFQRLPENPIVADDDVCAETARVWLEDFTPHVAQHRDRPGYVQVEVGPEDEGRGSDRPNLYARAAQRVAELRAEAPGFTIGVLTRTNSAVAQLFLLLRDLNVPVSQEGGNPLTDSGACEALIALLRMADHPGDTVARYHVATSPLGEALDFPDHTDAGAAHRLATRLRRRLVDNGYGVTVTSLAKKIVGSCDPREARRLGQLAELAYRYDSEASLRPADFVRLVESQRVEDRTSADVRVMTVHQAKGLEFDIVVLPQLDDQIFKGGRTPIALGYRHEPGGRITAVFPSASAELRCLFPELEEPYRQRASAVFRDGLSTLYVALTRTRYALHAIIAPDGEKGPGTARTSARIVREALNQSDGALRPALPGATLHVSGRADWYRDRAAVPDGMGDESALDIAPATLRVRLGDRSGRSLRHQSPSQLHGGDSLVDVADLLSSENWAALERGSIVHAWFERINWIEDRTPDDDELLEIARAVIAVADETKLAALTAEFRQWIGRPAIRATLSRSRYPGEAEVECEAPFLRRSGDTLVEGSIDRLVVTYSEGRPIAAEIIDFKTARGSEPIDGLVKRYAGQLHAYREAVAEMFDIPESKCQATLLFLEAGEVRSV